MPIIQMPDGTLLEFPDDMPHNQIRDTIRERYNWRPKPVATTAPATRTNSVIEHVRRKYPQYSAISDDALTQRIGELYPQYRNIPDFEADFQRVKSKRRENIDEEAFRIAGLVLPRLAERERLVAAQEAERKRGEYWASVERRIGDVLAAANMLSKPISVGVPAAVEGFGSAVVGLAELLAPRE